MFTDRDLQELLNFSFPKSVLSVYLSTDPAEGNTETHKLHLRGLLENINLPKDTDAVLNYFNHAREWKGRSLVIFSCSALGFFRAFPLLVLVSNLVWLGDQPYIKPLANLLDSYGGYGVVVVDKQGARLFRFHLGELHEREEIFGEDIRHVKHGGASTFAGRRGGIAGRRRNNQETIERNIKDSSNFAARFFEENRIRRILIGGSDENVAKLSKHLPKSWQSLIVGNFPMNMDASPGEILERAMQVGRQAEAQRETKIVENMITAAAKGRNGVVRLDDTLDAVNQGNVQLLVLNDGFCAPGYQCKGCEYITTQKIDICPFCGKRFTRIDDAVEMAVRKTMQSGGDVEVVRSNSKLEKVGIGALLRY